MHLRRAEKGQPLDAPPRSGAKVPRGTWRAWRVNSEGYVERTRLLPDGTVEKQYQHRTVWESANRPLRDGETIHHKNRIRNDNRIENLELWITAQPAGARVEDVLEWARWVIQQYS